MKKSCLLLLIVGLLATCTAQSSETNTITLTNGVTATVLQEYKESYFVFTDDRSKPFFVDKAPLEKKRQLDQKLAEVQEHGGTIEIPVTSPIDTNAPEKLDSFLKDFKWDRTEIMPERFAFLALPFIKQTNGGICAAASAVNVISYIDPSIDLKQGELFKIYNDREGGASFDEVVRGLRMLGFSSEVYSTRATPYAVLAGYIRKSLDANHPILVADKRHMLTIIGYNKESKTITAWNQWKNGKIQHGMPKGAYDVKNSDLPFEFTTVFFLHHVKDIPAASQKKQIEDFVGKTNDLHIHPPYQPRYPLSPTYLQNAAEERILASIRANRNVFILQGNQLIEITPQKETGDLLTVTRFPSKEQSTMSIKDLADKITFDNHGFFFSSLPPPPDF